MTVIQHWIIPLCALDVKCYISLLPSSASRRRQKHPPGLGEGWRRGCARSSWKPGCWKPGSRRRSRPGSGRPPEEDIPAAATRRWRNDSGKTSHDWFFPTSSNKLFWLWCIWTRADSYPVRGVQGSSCQLRDGDLCGRRQQNWGVIFRCLDVAVTVGRLFATSPQCVSKLEKHRQRSVTSAFIQNKCEWPKNI